MSSEFILQSSLMRWNNNVSLAIIVAVVYDYVLTFPKEIKYIWSKPWTWVWTLFILVRYCGLLSLMCLGLYGTTFVPGPEKLLSVLSKPHQSIPLTDFQGEAMYIAMEWSYFLFLAAADYMMLLRVWVIYNRSRIILGILLVLFFIEIVSMIVFYAYGSDPKNLTWGIGKTLGYSFCSLADSEPIILDQMVFATQITFSVILCMFAIIQFMRQSLQMYRTTRQWQVNRYINLLVKQGILYFVALLLVNLITLLWNLGEIPSNNGQSSLVNFVELVPLFTLAPRFVISIRELYKHGAQGERGGGIDSGFGISTLSDRGATGSQMVFASPVENDTVEPTEPDARQDEGVGNIQMMPRDIESA